MAGTSSPTGSTSQVSQAMPRPASEHLNCPLCYNAIEDCGSLIWCRHAFCFNCIIQWSTRRTTCPVCQWPFQYVLRNLRVPDYTVYHITWSTISASHARGRTSWPDTAGRHNRRPFSRDRSGSRFAALEMGQSRSRRQHRDAHRRVRNAQGYDPSTIRRQHQRTEDTVRDEGQASRHEGNVIASWERSEHHHHESWLSYSEGHTTRSRSRWRSRSSRRHTQQEEPRQRDRADVHARSPEERSQRGGRLSSRQQHTTRSRSWWRTQSPDGHRA